MNELSKLIKIQNTSFTLEKIKSYNNKMTINLTQCLTPIQGQCSAYHFLYYKTEPCDLIPPHTAFAIGTSSYYFVEEQITSLPKMSQLEQLERQTDLFLILN